MKIKNYFPTALLFALGVIFMTSCNNEDNSLEMASSDIINSNEDDVISIDSLFNIGSEDFSAWENGNTVPPVTRSSSVTPITAYGYSSYTSSGIKKAFIGPDVAKALGIADQIYFGETLTVYYNLRVTGLGQNAFFSYAESPSCGMSPNNSSQIGYSYSQDGENVIMATKIYHIISDLSGRSYDRWYPRHPNELQWNYMFIQI